MQSETSTRAYYDTFSQGYDRGRGEGYHALVDELEFEAVLPYARDAHVLEVGCGTGLLLERLASVARSAKGIDLSPGMLERARARGLDVVEGSATAIPFADASFDFVCSFKVLAHVPAIESALEEIRRVTRPGGHVALEFYNPLSLRYAAKKLAGPRPIGEGTTEADVFTRWDRPDDIRRLLPSGLELVDFAGVRVVTPAAFVHRVPLLRDVVARAERACLHSPLRTFAGFLIAVARRT